MAKSKRIDELHHAWWEEASAKARRLIQCRFTRKQRRWLPLIENFGQREWLEQERIYSEIAPKMGRKIERADSYAMTEKVSKLLWENVRHEKAESEQD
ncbi:hypothetical protein MYE70_10540 [Marinobacter alexandrii]|uniref:hypothetical protein n=1 Tax=Marinobacter alexandrii TaxID=2570351 RepID=UPI001FFF340A|nr:hypothetical protein [Marinobacter alexandrii]MCK2149503.1 hypothetical protein [Marinobacter alexandrii]